MREANLPTLDRIDSDHLVPHRLRLDLGDYLDEVFDTPQVYISLERTHYYVDGAPRPAMRVRWVANTHAHEDEVLLDEKTMGVVQVEAVGSNIREDARAMAFLRGDSVTSIVLRGTGETQSVTEPWPDDRAFHLMMLPYLFASLDYEPGSTFVLPQFTTGSAQRLTFTAEVVGPVPESPSEWHYRSDHGWVSIDWYVDRVSPPYLTRMTWTYRGGARDGVVSEQRVADFALFDGDRFRGVVR